MKGAHLLLSLSLALVDAAYVGHGATAPARRSLVARTAGAEMVATKEVFSQYLEGTPSLQKTLTKVPTPLTDGAAAAAIAATAAAGFALTPSSRLAVNVVGGALSSTLGVKLRGRLLGERKKAAVPAVAALLSDGLQGVSPASLGDIAKEYGIEQGEFQAQLGELYLAYIDACLESSQVETAELSELLRLGTVLGLSPAQVGNKVYAAARNLYSRHRAYLEDPEESESKAILSKFIFLAERVVSADESEEGYRYETLRLQKQFGLLPAEWKDRAEKAAVPFYQKALASAVLEGKAVTSEQLGQVRASLGITDGTASAMHLEVLGSHAAALLQPERGADAKLAAADGEALDAASVLLGVEPSAVDDALAALTGPLYKATFEGLTASPPAEADERLTAQVGGALTLRRSELRLPEAAADEIEKGALREVAAAKFAAASEFIRAQNVAAALEETRALIGYARGATALMQGFGRADGADADGALEALFGNLDKGGAKGSEVLSLYRVFLLACLEGLKVTAEDAAALSALRSLAGISQAESDSVYEASAGPLFKTTVLAAVDGEMDAAAKTLIEQSLADLSLPPSVTQSLQLEVYGEKLASKTEIRKIVDEEGAAALLQLRDFLGLSFDDVEPLHAQTFTESYGTSVREVFKQSAPIPDEYWEGLEELQKRLGLGEATCTTTFAAVAAEALKGKGEAAVEALEAKARADQAMARKESGSSTPEDEKGSLAIDATKGEKMLDEILGMIEFATATRVLQEGGIACSLRGQMEDRALKELYRQFLIEAFSGKSAEQNERVFANMDKLALVLGLKEDEVSAIHNELGATIYRQVCNKALKEGPLGATERQTLESIKETLGMEPSRCEQLIGDCQLFRVQGMVEAMFERSSVTAEDSRAVRDMADLLDVDLLEDAKVVPFKLERMYMVELEDVINAGDMTPEKIGDELSEICEPLHIDEPTAARLLQQTVAKRAAGGLLQAAALLRQNNQQEAIAELEAMLKFAALAPDMGEVNAKSVSMRERNELALLYQASSLSGGELDETAKDKLELLREIAGIQS